MENQTTIPERIVNKKTFKDYIKLRKKDESDKEIRGMEEYLKNAGFSDPSSWNFDDLDQLHDLLKDYNKLRDKIIKYEKKGKEDKRQEALRELMIALAQLVEFGYNRPVDVNEDLSPYIEDLDAQFKDWDRNEEFQIGKKT